MLPSLYSDEDQGRGWRLDTYEKAPLLWNVSLGRLEAAELGWRRRGLLEAENEREKKADGIPALQGQQRAAPVGEGHRQGRAAWWQQVLGGGNSWNGRERIIQSGRGVEKHSQTGFSEETRRASSVSRASLG